jgi:hypothetical protein
MEGRLSTRELKWGAEKGLSGQGNKGSPDKFKSIHFR